MNSQNSLNSNDVDKGVALIKGITGAIPLIGPMVAEIMGEIIPHQRTDRMKEFLQILDERLGKLEISQDELNLKMKEESYINLFEEGLWQSARSSSTMRKEYIASMLANGISYESLEKIEGNILLSLLGQLSDNEIITLFSYTQKCRILGGNDEFTERHKDILRRPNTYVGSSQEDRDKETMYDTYREKLVRLDLIKRTFKEPKKGQLPEFDKKTGMIKTKGYQLTSLGRIFLKYIDMEEE
jgi:hypothetical protein